MNTDKVDPSKKDATISSADDLSKTKQSDIELNEEELSRVTGGKHVANVKWTPGTNSP